MNQEYKIPTYNEFTLECLCGTLYRYNMITDKDAGVWAHLPSTCSKCGRPIDYNTMLKIYT